MDKIEDRDAVAKQPASGNVRFSCRSFIQAERRGDDYARTPPGLESRRVASPGTRKSPGFMLDIPVEDGIALPAAQTLKPSHRIDSCRR
ncbi:hypothetical protein [Burkholderia catarinensis]|uniref:hypothetical protein n=1 Tax=Burkholderia catarinensis TaxID=1108140 RepID=UPI000ACF94AD|nr:hypothetical protein [Burkholderia catarinensis]